MKRADPEIAAAAAELAAETSPGRGPHPSAEELIAYHRGELSAAEEERIRDHLLSCPEDTSLLLDLEKLESGELGRDHPASEFEIAAAWRATQAAIPPRAKTKPRRRIAWLQAAAAVLAFAVLGQALWLQTLRRSVADLSRPQLEAQVIDLFPSALRGQEPATRILALDADDRWLTLVLVLDPAAVDGDYELTVATAGGERVWSGGGARPNELGSLAVILSRDLIPPGDYQLMLHRPGETEPVAEYRLRIEAAAEGG